MRDKIKNFSFRDFIKIDNCARLKPSTFLAWPTITLCEECHKGVHRGEIVLDKKPKKLNLKHTTHMSIIRSQLLKRYPDAVETFGFVTKLNRNNLGLPKDHFIDACVIASGGELFKLNDEIFYKRRVAKGSYRLTRGKRGEQRLNPGKIQGFRTFDKVRYFDKECFIGAKGSRGYATLVDIFGNEVDFSYMPRGLKTPKLANLERISARRSCLCQRITLDANHALS